MNDDVTLKLHLDDSEVVKGMSATQRWLKTIEGTHNLRFGGNHKEITQSLNQMRSALKMIQSQRITVKAKIDEVQRAEQKLKELRQALKDATTNQQRIKILADIQDAKKELDSLTGGRGSKARIIELEAELAEIDVDKNAISAAARQAEAELKLTPTVDWGAAFRKGKSVQGAIGTSLETIGNAFSSIGNNPISKALTGAMYQVGYAFTNSMSTGLSQAVDRFDTIRTFPKVMERIGFSTKESNESIEKMKDAVSGMPTGLDELTSSAQQYALVMNDLEKGTDLAIAVDTAFLASGATEADKYQGVQQIRDLLSGKELNSREWNSLIASMPVGIRAIGKELNYTEDEYDKLTADLRDNKIDNKTFIDAMIAVGGLDGELRKLAVDSVADKISTSMTIIRQAFTRLGESVLGALDTQLNNITGTGIVGNLWKVKEAIDEVSAEIVKWINENPDKIQRALEAIGNFDYMGFLKGFAQGLYNGFKLLAKAVSSLPKINAGKLGYLIGILPMFGKLVTTLGQFVKGTSFIGGAVGVGIKFLQVKGIGGIFGKLGSLFSGLKQAKLDKLGDAATVAGAQSKVALAGFKTFAINLGKLALIGGTIVAAVAGVKYIIKSFEEIGNLDMTNVGDGFALFAISFAGIAAAATAIGAASSVLSAAIPFVTEGALALEVIIGFIGLIVTTVAGFIALDTALFAKGAENIKKVAEQLDETGKILDTFHWNEKSVTMMEKAVDGISRITGQIGLLESLSAKWKSSNLAQIANDFVGFAEDIGKIAATIAEVKPIPDGATDNFSKAIDGFYEMLEMFRPGNKLGNLLDLSVLDDGEIGTKEAENLRTIMDDLVAVFNKLAEIPKTITKLAGEVEKLVVNPAGTITPLDTYKSYIETFSEKLSGLFDEIIKDFNKEIFQNYAEKVSEIVGYLNDTFTALDQIRQTIEKSSQGMKGLYKSVNSGTLIGDMKTYVGNLSKDLAEMLDSLWENLKKFVGGNVLEGSASKIKGVVENFKLTLDSLVEIVPVMDNFRGLMQDMNQNSRDSGGISAYGYVSQLAEQMKLIVEALDTVPEGEDIIGKVGNIKTAMENMRGVVEALQGVREQLDASETEGIETVISDIITQISTSLKGIEDDEGLLTRVTAFKNALDQLKATISGFGGAGLNVNFEVLSQSILNVGKSLDEITGKMQTAGSEWSSALTNGIDMSGVVSKVNGAMDTILTSMTEKGTAAGAAYRAALIAQLQNITFTISATLNATAVWGQLMAIKSYASNIRIGSGGGFGSRFFGFNTGGMVTGMGVLYRAIGGSIFKKRGTDIVPAMLTPGEYVMKRRAVKAYGPGFMQRLNNLDLPGAIESLTTKASGLLPNVNGSVVNNYSTNNNNQSVTQNITTNNPNYTFRRANRFVRALS